ncbi:MAG: squalene/phytoene synthase family protein [Sphingomonadaceae bacterium]
MTATLAALLPAPAPADLDPVALAAAITRASGTSFGPGMAILPRTRREGMHAVYAFCRMVDDIADGPFPAADKHAALAAWGEEIGRLYAGQPRSAVGRALQPAITSFALPETEFRLMIEGMAMDAHGPIVAPVREQLARYTRRVAGSVGALSMRIFGAWRGDVSDRFAHALGDAFQLTNILRDIEGDAAIGRLYLPREMLDRHGIPPDPQAVPGHPALPALCRQLGAEARACYNEARALASAHSRVRLAPALVMMGAYEAYLDRMEARNFARPLPEPLLGKREKLWHGLRYALAGPGPARA